MSAIKNVIFDLGAVLLDIDPERSIKAFREMAGPGVYWDKAWKQGITHIKALEEGRISEAKFLSAMRDTINPEARDEEVIHAWNQILLSFTEERIEMLRRARNHYKLYLLSNSNSIHYRAYSQELERFEKGGFNSLFDGVVFSYKVGHAKPDPNIYSALIRQYNLDPAASVFIDDRKDNIEAASEFGITTIWLEEHMEVTELFDNEGKLLA